MAEIICPLHEAAHMMPHLPVITDGDERLTYAQFNEQVLRMQAGLMAKGVVAGDRVGLLMPVNGAYVSGLVALWRMQAVACPLNSKMPHALLNEQVEALDLKGIICESLSAEIEMTEFCIGALLGEEPLSLTVAPSLSLSAQATLLFTSGSSAKPKIAVHSIQAHYYSALGSNRNIRLKPHDIWLLSLPLHHVGGLAIVWRCLLGGACIGLPSEAMRLPDFLKYMKVTHVSMVSTQLRELLQHDAVEEIAEQLSALLIGGGPQCLSLLREAVLAGIPVLPTYGSTEMSSQITTMPLHSFARKAESSGKLLSYRMLELADDGEIFVQGETLFDGYLMEGVLEPSVDAEGWFHTGDLGALDEDGFLRVLGRKDRLFISGGENIQPEEIEAALLAQASIEAAVVIPVDDEVFGQRPVAYLKGVFDEEVLRVALGGRLLKFKVPVAFYLLPEALCGGLKGVGSEELLEYLSKEV